MNAALRLYLKSSAVSVLAKGLLAASAVFVLYALNQMLDKDAFGTFMLALSVCLLAAFCLSGGFRSLIMYHVAREHEKNITGVSLFWGGVLSILCAAVFVLAAQPLAESMGKPGLVFWLEALAPFVPAYTVNIILTSHYRADKDVVTMLLFQEILPALLKIILLGLVWVLGMSKGWIAGAFSASFFLPLFLLYFKKPIPLRFRFDDLGWWDLKYGVSAFFNQAMSKSTVNLMMLMIGYFASAAAVAEFAVAMRFAQILLLPKMMLAQLHVPRIGARLGRNEKDGLLKEYDVVRNASLLLTLLGCLFLLMAGMPFLMLFGDYARAYPLLLLLAAANVVRAGFGDAGDFLAMTGRTASILWANIAAFTGLILCFVIFVPLWGNYGSGLAVFASALLGMGINAALLKHHEKVFILTPLAGIVMAMAASGLILLATHFWF